MKIGDTVVKKSGKPFQNKMKEAVIVGFSSMIIPTNPQNGIRYMKEVEAVILKDCVGLVREDTLEVKE